MKRIFLVLISIAFVVSLSAQSDSERMARMAYAEEEYADAIELYKAAIALTSDTAAKSTLEKRLSNARACYNTRNQAAKSYSEGKYDEALELYMKLLKYNSADSQAKKYTAILQQRKQEASRQAKKRELMKKIIQKEYLPALSGTADQMKAFISKYPDMDESKILSDIIAIEPSFNTTNRDDLLLEIGKEYKKYGYKSSANRYLNKSASLGNPEALYVYAHYSFAKDTDAWVTLMALSAEGGYQQAAEDLKGAKKYSKSSANRMYNHMIACRSNLESARYIKTNAGSYYLDFDISEIYGYMTWDVDLNTSSTYDLYDMAEALESGSKRKMDLYKAAAFRGNVDAMYSFADYIPACLDHFNDFPDPIHRILVEFITSNL